MSVDLPEPFGPMSPSVSPRISVAVRVFDEHAIFDADRRVLRDDDAIAAALGDLEAHRHRRSRQTIGALRRGMRSSRLRRPFACLVFCPARLRAM